MPFPANTGILQPSDFKIVHRVYTEIASEPWFTTDLSRREQFALLVIDTYRQGRTNPPALKKHCRIEAIQKFGNAAAALH